MTLETIAVQPKGILLPEKDLRIFVPSMETFESEEAFTILVDVPGLDPNSIVLDCDGDQLRVEGVVGRLGIDLHSTSLRPCTQKFFEIFELSADLDDQSIEAEFYDGSLQITIPKLFSENHEVFEPAVVH